MSSTPTSTSLTPSSSNCSDASRASGSSTSCPDMRGPENVLDPTAHSRPLRERRRDERQPDPRVENEARVVRSADA